MNIRQGLMAALLALATSLPLAAVDKAVEAKIRAAFVSVNPNIVVESVAPSEMPGLFVVEFEGGETAYATPDGKFFLIGNLFGIDGKNFVNYTEQRHNAAEGKRAVKRKQEIDKLDPSDAIVFKAKGDTKAVIHVFTDIDCFYCQKFHSEMASYNQLGIEVHYLAYPRAGIPSDSYNKLVTAWCTKDQQTALTEMKKRRAVPAATCKDNPVADQYALGQRLGINGTPSIITPEGRLLPGYLPAADLARELGIAK